MIAETAKKKEITPQITQATYARFREFTMVPYERYLANLELVARFSDQPGAVVECGTWKGGMIAGIASFLGDGRDYVLADSFEGLPPVQELDGDRAKKWEEEKGVNALAADVETAKAAMARAGILSPRIAKGWFSDTLPKLEMKGEIALLRMDGDWYQSTIDILDNLFFKVRTGGLIIIDDYFAWEGCSLAVHDFLSKHKRPEKLNQYKGVAFMVKR